MIQLAFATGLFTKSNLSLQSSVVESADSAYLANISDRPGVTMHPAHPDRAFDKRVKHVIEPLLDFYNIFFLLYRFQKFQVQLLKTM